MTATSFDETTLPTCWDVVPLKAVASYFVSNVDKVPDASEEPVRLCNYTDVYKNEFINSAQMELMRSTATAYEIEKFGLFVGDVIITKDSETWEDIAVPALVVHADDDLVCGYHLAMLRPMPDRLEGRFLFRCLQSKAIRLALELASTGVTRYGLPKGDIGNLRLPLPSLSTQATIAAYLDRETTAIDALIAEKESMLGLLEEKRQALVSHAVTQGINSKAKMKPTGIAWLDRCPAHWEIMQLKRTWGSADYGTSSSIRDKGEIRVLRMSCITKSGTIDLNNAGQIEEIDESLFLKKGDILFNRTNSLDQIAKVGLVVEEPDDLTAFASYLVRIRVNERVDNRYLVKLLNSRDFLKFARANAIPAIGQANLSPTRYGDLHVPIPPRTEQLEIVEHIDEAVARSNAFETDLEMSITLLKERRSALITAAVTGQIPVEEMEV